MTTYIALLRGINVSGQKMIKMDMLKKSFERLGFTSITTYLQSGNVIFRSKETDISGLENTISNQIEKDAGFRVPIIVLSLKMLKQITESNPFLKDRNKDIKFMHITFLSVTPEHIDIKVFEDKMQKGEEIIFSEKVIFLYCQNGYGRTKLTNNFIETKLKLSATTRNWKTATELLKIAQFSMNQIS